MPDSTTRALPPIAFALDDNYVRQLCVVLRSLAATNQEHLSALRVIVIHQSLCPSSIQRLTRHAEDAGLHIEFRHSAFDPDGYPTWGWVTSASYLRLALTELLPEYDTVLYLDTDVLILGDVMPLLRTELGDAPLAAVQDSLIPVLKCGLGLPRYRELGLDGDREYFNAGVLMLNLSACRKLGTLARAKEFIESSPENVLFFDQDALNWAADDNWVRLDRCWNTFPVSATLESFGPLPCEHEMAPYDVLFEAERTARIMHYAGPHKPWNAEFPAGELRDRYAAVLADVDAADLQLT